MAIDATPRNAAHLLRRAAWGGTQSEIAEAADRGIEGTVEQLLDPTDAPEAGHPVHGPGQRPYEADSLALWFARLAATSATPAIERLAWFWHGHFATNIDKVERVDLGHLQLTTLRRLGLGRFDDLLSAMTHDPAMNLWLDLHTSVRGAPNENYARELMELFSLGRGQGYTQADVAAAARALTGYTIVEERPAYFVTGTRLNPALHDFEPVTFLGRTGSFDAEHLIEIICERPECHRFIAGRFWHRYAGTSMPNDVGDKLASVFAAELRIDQLLTALLTHPAFYSDEVKQGLVTQPTESLVGAIRGFDLELPDVTAHHMDTLTEMAEEDDDSLVHPGALGWWGGLMGQQVGRPPNVAGWPHNEAWLDSNRAAGRLQVGEDLGWHLAGSPNETADHLRSLTERPADLAVEILSRFGLVEWSRSTEAAVSVAAAADYPELSIAAAVTAAFTSPEVTLA